MTPFSQVTGPAAPLLVANVDTDVIIRSGAGLYTNSQEVLGKQAFAAWRYRPDGSEEPGFVLNRPQFRGAPILLTGANFGCGSSRERAVWALVGAGVRCVIAPSFGGIFEANCAQNGVLPFVLPEETVRELASEAEGGATFTVDLQACTLTSTVGTAIHFQIDEMRRQSLLQGRDDIEMTMLDVDAIDAWQVRDRAERPWIWAANG